MDWLNGFFLNLSMINDWLNILGEMDFFREKQMTFFS